MDLLFFIVAIPFGFLAGFAILNACTLAGLAIEELLSARDGEGLFAGLTASLIYVPLGLGIAYIFYQASSEAYGVGVGILWSFWVFKFPSFLFTDGDD